MAKPKEVAERKLEAFNAHDTGQTMACFSPAVVMSTPIGVLEGHEQVSGLFSAFWSAFPDLKLSVVQEVAEGEVVVYQLRSRGTHLGTLSTPAGDIPATSRFLDLAMSDHLQVQDGLIVAVQLYFDRLSLLEQLGAVPAGSAS